MTQEDYRHPIAPPPELVRQWWDDFHGAFYEFKAITTKVFQAGADQELEACCEWLASLPNNWTSTALKRVSDLRAARRPKSLSLKEQALALLQPGEPRLFNSEMQDTIRRALEQLPDNE